MRIALLSDIHGNLLALNAVLDDISKRGGVDEYWLLGDYCAIGYDPAGVLDRLQTLPNARFIRGNADRYVYSLDRPGPTVEQTKADLNLLPVLLEVAGTMAWTTGHLAARGWLEWLGSLPLDISLTLPDGTRVLLVHASPGLDDGDGLNPSLSDAELWEKIGDSDADLICIGHFHIPIDRTLKGKRVINPGCVSNPIGGMDTRASYAILEATESSHSITFHRVAYDIQATIALVKQTGCPGAGFIVRVLTVGMQPEWLANWDSKTHLPIFS